MADGGSDWADWLAGVDASTWAAVAGWATSGALLVMWARSGLTTRKPVRQAPTAALTGSAEEAPQVFVIPPRPPLVSSPSSFCAKVDLFCRLAGIPAAVQPADFSKAPTATVPYMTHSGNTIGDSTLIVDYLERCFFDGEGKRVGAGEVAQVEQFAGGAVPSLAPLASLPPGDYGLLLAVQRLLEDHTYPLCIMFNFLDDKRWAGAKAATFGALPWGLRDLIAAHYRASIGERSYLQGFTRVAQEDAEAACVADLKALEGLLAAGKRRAAAEAGLPSSEHVTGPFFLLGRTPTSVDAALFGALDVALHASPPLPPLTDAAWALPHVVEFTKRVRLAYYGEDTGAPAGAAQ